MRFGDLKRVHADFGSLWRSKRFNAGENPPMLRRSSILSAVCGHEVEAMMEVGGGGRTSIKRQFSQPRRGGRKVPSFAGFAFPFPKRQV